MATTRKASAIGAAKCWNRSRCYAPAFAVALMLFQGCAQQEHPVHASPSTGPDAELHPYAPGAWRLARHEIGNVFFTVSHILIAYQRSTADQKPTADEPDGPPVTSWFSPSRALRGREEARSLAASIASQARVAPATFAGLALKYSDDLATREQGGSLGTAAAGELPASFLDALATLKPGETSRVVETERGFHILQRRANPPDTKVAARRILIGYESEGRYPLREGVTITRSREEAKTLATRVATLAADHPDRFQQLVETYSEHSDAQRGGDFGVWSNYEPSSFAREIEAIAQLELGETSAPIEERRAFNVFLRTEVTERLLLAATYVGVNSLIPLPAGRDGELLPELPADVRPLLSGHGESFEVLQAKYCCARVDQWRQGRGLPGVEQLVSTLAIGEISSRPLRIVGDIFHFYRRVAPAPEAPPSAPRFELPNPSAPDVDTIVSSVPGGEAIGRFLASLQRTLGEGLGLELEPEKRKRVSETLSTLTAAMQSSSADKRLEVLQAARAQLEALLGPTRYAQVRANIRSELTRTMLNAP